MTNVKQFKREELTFLFIDKTIKKNYTQHYTYLQASDLGTSFLVSL